ncbi:MAG: HAD family phosphatase [Chloroflexota bacterium]
MIKALLLDFGGVIGKIGFEIHHLTEQILGIPSGTLTWRGPFDPASDPLWQSMQRDEITEREYWRLRAQELGRYIGEEWTASDYWKRVNCDDPERTIRPEAIETIKMAKTLGLKVGVFSNELEFFYGRECMSRISLLKAVDSITDATHTKVLKPDPKAYQFAIDDLGVAPEAILFVDDQHRNIVGAQKVGLQTYHFDFLRPAECYAEVQEQLKQRK